MTRGVHGEKIVAVIESDKVPKTDIPPLEKALGVYDKWVKDLNSVEANTLDELVIKMVSQKSQKKQRPFMGRGN